MFHANLNLTCLGWRMVAIAMHYLLAAPTDRRGNKLNARLESIVELHRVMWPPHTVPPLLASKRTSGTSDDVSWSWTNIQNHRIPVTKIQIITESYQDSDNHRIPATQLSFSTSGFKVFPTTPMYTKAGPTVFHEKTIPTSISIAMIAWHLSTPKVTAASKTASWNFLTALIHASADIGSLRVRVVAEMLFHGTLVSK